MRAVDALSGDGADRGAGLTSRRTMPERSSCQQRAAPRAHSGALMDRVGFRLVPGAGSVVSLESASPTPTPNAPTRRRALHRPAQAPRGSATARPPALAGSSRQAGSLARSPWAVKPPSAVPPSANCGSPPAFHHPRPPAMRLRMPVPWSPEGRTTTQLHGALVVVVALAVAVVRSPVVAPLVAATGRLGAAAPLGPVAGQAAQATNRPGGVPPRAPLRQRGVPAVRLPPERTLGVSDVPALPVLHRLLDRPIPGTAALDGGGPLAPLPRPFRLQQLDRAGVGAVAPCLHAQQLAPPVQQVGVGLLVGLVVLLGLSGVAFAVGGTVSGLLGDLVGLLCLLGLLTRSGEVASAQPPGRTLLQAGQ